MLCAKLLFLKESWGTAKLYLPGHTCGVLWVSFKHVGDAFWVFKDVHRMYMCPELWQIEGQTVAAWHAASLCIVCVWHAIYIALVFYQCVISVPERVCVQAEPSGEGFPWRERRLQQLWSPACHQHQPVWTDLPRQVSLSPSSFLPSFFLSFSFQPPYFPRSLSLVTLSLSSSPFLLLLTSCNFPHPAATLNIHWELCEVSPFIYRSLSTSPVAQVST